MIDFIQLGANVGKSYSDIMWWLVPQEGWSGIFVEPNPDAYEKLIECYRDLENCFFEKVAIGAKLYDDKLETEIKKDSVVMELGNSGHFHETSKVVPEHREDIIEQRPDQYIRVPNMTLEEIVEKYNMTGKEFKLLQIDIEGSDYAVLLSIDFDKICPQYVRVETIHMENINCSLGDHCPIFPKTCQTEPSSRKVHIDRFMQLSGYKEIKDPWYEKYVEHVTADFPGAKPEPEKYNTTYFKEIS